jgi:hypothetical protein
MYRQRATSARRGPAMFPISREFDGAERNAYRRCSSFTIITAGFAAFTVIPAITSIAALKATAGQIL